jgi:hypothetical protein
MIAPLSDKRYIINEDLNLFIIINWNKVEITNHVFHYDVVLSKRDHERVIYLYDTETEKRRTNTESNVKANIKNSLDTLLTKIKRKTIELDEAQKKKKIQLSMNEGPPGTVI